MLGMKQSRQATENEYKIETQKLKMDVARERRRSVSMMQQLQAGGNFGDLARLDTLSVIIHVFYTSRCILHPVDVTCR